MSNPRQFNFGIFKMNERKYNDTIKVGIAKDPPPLAGEKSQPLTYLILFDGSPTSKLSIQVHR